MSATLGARKTRAQVCAGLPASCLEMGKDSLERLPWEVGGRQNRLGEGGMGRSVGRLTWEGGVETRTDT